MFLKRTPTLVEILNERNGDSLYSKREIVKKWLRSIDPKSSISLEDWELATKILGTYNIRLPS